MARSTGVGTILYRGQTVPPPAPGLDVFVPVGNVQRIGGPQIAKEQVEVPSLDSNGGFKEFLSGLKDPGQLTFVVNQDPANPQHIGCRNDAQASSALSQRNWRIVWSNGEQADFVGEVLNYNRDTQPNSVLTADITTQISGLVSFS